MRPTHGGFLLQYTEAQAFLTGRKSLMPDYAVIVYFDHVSEGNIRRIQSEVSRVTGNTYLSDNRILPHITLTLFSKESFQEILEDLASFAPELRDMSVSLSSIGIFNSTPAVVNLLPVVSDELIRIHASLTGILSRHISDFNPYYERSNWVPHCAVAVNIAPDELTGAIETTCRLFTPMTCTFSALSLVECNPYSKAAEWKISPT